MEGKKEREELEDLAIKFEAQADKIVVKKVSLAGKMFEIIMDLIYKTGRILAFLFAAFIMSAGATALLNPSIRDILFNYLPFVK